MDRRPFSTAAGPSDSEGMIIHYDHAATFELTGRPGNIVQDVINVGSDGVFVAVAIGYGFEEQRARPINNPTPAAALAPLEDPTTVGDVTLGDLPLAAVIEGFRISPNPQLTSLVFGDQSRRSGATGDQPFNGQPLSADFIFDKILERVKAPQDISFFFSIIDSGSGREFQDQPAHNLASLGKSNGERPFRLLARPMTFLPGSTLRLQISERTEGVRGSLFIVLYGYKILGAAGCAEPIVRSWGHTSQGYPVETFGEPDARAIPFDYVATFDLTGRPGNIIEDEISVNVEGGFIATSIGYGLAAENRDVDVTVPDGKTQTLPDGRKVVNLTQLPLLAFPSSALLDGIRLRPDFLRVASNGNGNLANQLPLELVDVIFERLNRPEDVSFRYAIFDTGTGRELQNRPLNNIAGLGIANGDRPFKKLARPMSFLPRSTIRVQVEERFGRGTLFIAFQGYKLLGATPRGGRL
jgi:hypothetical protein